MKIKLEEVLLKEAKVPRSHSEGGMSTVEEMAEYYLSGHSLRSGIGSAAEKLKLNPSVGMGDWHNITIWVGMFLRAHADGYNMMEMVGLTREEAMAVHNSVLLLRERCSQYKKNNPTTPTSQLYAQVKQLGF